MLRLLFASCLVFLAGSAFSADCRNTSTGLVPITDMGEALYLGLYPGGLYPAADEGAARGGGGGVGVPPPAHAESGLAHAKAVVPRDAAGEPSENGAYVLLSIGMSNTTQEFCGGNYPNCAPYSFVAKSGSSAFVEQEHLVIVDGAKGGQTASTWDDPNDPNYDRVRDEELAPLGLSEAQVQVLWIKVADAQPQVGLPAAEADAFALLKQMGDIARAARQRYPNLQIAFVSSRIYAGYASTGLNPEPYAYESGFAVKWLVAAQIAQMAGEGIDDLAGDLDYTSGVAPWIAWGPYLWADGLTPRSDGLIWQCNDLGNDGTHPSPAGREKVAGMLLSFMMQSPFAAPWFLKEPPGVVGDLNGDSLVNGADLGLLLAAAGPCSGCLADLNGDGIVNGADIGLLLAAWTE